MQWMMNTQQTDRLELWHQQKTSPLFLSFPLQLQLDAAVHPPLLSLSVFLPFPLLACQTALSPSHHQAGSPLLAMLVSPFLLLLYHLLLLFLPQQLFWDPLHLWWHHLLFPLLCTSTLYPCRRQAIWMRGILRGMASFNRPGLLLLSLGLTHLYHHQTICLCGKTLINSQ